MFELIDCEFEKEMNDALCYVAKKMSETGHNSKPVLLHSFKVAMTLYQYNYSKKIIISAILHDLIEDTDVKYDDIKRDFSKEVADIVKSVSFDPTIKDKLKQAKELFNNCIKFGYEALIVKCADLVDNINYVNLVDNCEVREKLWEKYKMFLEMTNPLIKDEIIYKLLEKKYNEKNK